MGFALCYSYVLHRPAIPQRNMEGVHSPQPNSRGTCSNTNAKRCWRSRARVFHSFQGKQLAQQGCQARVMGSLSSKTFLSIVLLEKRLTDTTSFQIIHHWASIVAINLMFLGLVFLGVWWRYGRAILRSWSRRTLSGQPTPNAHYLQWWLQKDASHSTYDLCHLWIQLFWVWRTL